jgi:hypothetical protein
VFHEVIIRFYKQFSRFTMWFGDFQGLLAYSQRHGLVMDEWSQVQGVRREGAIKTYFLDGWTPAAPARPG